MIVRIMLLATLMLAAGSVGAAEVADPFPRMASAYLVQIQGKTVWARRPVRRLPQASLTKIMTAILVLERCKLDEVVTVSRRAAGETGSRIGLRVGERFRLEDLLAAMLVASANDACHALADHLAGSEERFVSLMNARARGLGLDNSRFANACGHDAPNHYSTARDLAILAETALKNPAFGRLVSSKRLKIRTVDRRRAFSLVNRNKLLGRSVGVSGVKTGYTENAGRCLVALAERDGTRVLLVLLNAPHRFRDAVVMIERAFAVAPPGRFGNRSTAPFSNRSGHHQ